MSSTLPERNKRGRFISKRAAEAKRNSPQIFKSKVQEQEVLQEELKSVPKGASVYKKQQNSNIFFKTTREKAFEESKRTIDSLILECDEVENMTTEARPGAKT